MAWLGLENIGLDFYVVVPISIGQILLSTGGCLSSHNSKVSVFPQDMNPGFEFRSGHVLCAPYHMSLSLLETTWYTK